MKPGRYSPSQVNMYLRCPASWEFRYVDGLKVPPAAALIRGTAVDEPATVNGRQKIQSHVDMPLGDLLDIAATEVDRRISNEGLLPDPEHPASEIKDAAVEYTRAYREKLAPTLQPTHVQHGFTLSWDSTPEISFTGKMDLIDSTHRVRDLKTSIRSPSNGEVDGNNRFQLSAYALGHQVEFGSLPVECVDDTIVVQKRETRVVPVGFVPTPEDTRLVEVTVANVHAGVKAGAFPANRGSFLCSRRNCGFWSACEKRHGGKVRP